MLDHNPAWVAVMTLPNYEQRVARAFADAQPAIECYLPMLANKDRRFKKDLGVEKPMFPCYMFARINARQIYQTRTTRGVRFIVSSQHSIIQVPESEIEAVRRFEASQRKMVIVETSKLVKGATATIMSGEFAGLQGRLLKACKDGNFAVNITVMNMSFVVHIKRSELRPADDSAEETPPDGRLSTIR